MGVKRRRSTRSSVNSGRYAEMMMSSEKKIGDSTSSAALRMTSNTEKRPEDGPGGTPDWRKPVGVDVLDGLVNAVENLARILAAAHEHDAFHAGGLADSEDAGRWGRADLDGANVADVDGDAFVFGDYDVGDVVGGLHQP